MPKLILNLYIAGETVVSKQLVKRLDHILKEEFENSYSLTVIDILKHPQLAEKDKIIAAPTLLKTLPPPARKVIGDLTNKEKVLLGLDIHTSREK